MGRYHLILLNILEGDTLILTNPLVSIIRDAIDASRSRGSLVICEEAGIGSCALASRGSFIELIHSTGRACGRNSAARRGGGRSVGVLLKLFKLSKYLVELPLPLLLLGVRFRDDEGPLFVDKVGSTDTTAYGAVDAIPLSLKVGLNLLQAVQGTHLLLRPLRRLLGARA